LDYDPFGMLTVGRSWSGGSEYRFGFNSQEQDDEVYGNGNFNTAEFWGYDTRLGRRWNLDPKSNPSISNYATFLNNPIFYSDLLGDTVIGLSARSATRTKDIIQGTFSKDYHKDFRKLISIGANGMAFKPISKGDFDKATANLNEDEKALAQGYYDAINAREKFRVGVVTSNETIGNYIGNMGLEMADGTILTPNSTGADVDAGAGGGFNVKINGNENLTLIVMDSKTVINEYRIKTTRKYSPGLVSSGETLAHEMLGHGLTRHDENNRYTQWVNAIRLSNLYLRVASDGTKYRDGSSHSGHGGVPGNSDQMNKIPEYLND